MRGLGVLLGTFLIAFATADRVDVPSDGRIVTLKPTIGRTENVFDLFAGNGCKMILTCMFKTYSCRISKIVVHDGEQMTQHCPEAFTYVFKNSFKHRMSVTIMNTGGTEGAFCQVKSTKPYIDRPEPLIDSSEHGLAHRSRKANTCRCGWTNKAGGRIVGGKQCGPNEYPFPILMAFANNRFPFCGGSIITPYHVLTAAHCTHPFQDRKLIVLVGEHDIRRSDETSATKIHNVINIHEHEQYNDNNNIHDIAILEVSPKIEFNDKVGPVCMPTQPTAKIDDFIKVMGWGLLKDKSLGGRASPVLMKVNLRVIDPDVCKSIYNIDPTRPTQICTYNNLKDSCQGDSGGPLVRLNPETNMYEQVALVSYGRKCASTDPAVNTDVAAYMPWIKQQISKSRSKAVMCH